MCLPAFWGELGEEGLFFHLGKCLVLPSMETVLVDFYLCMWITSVTHCARRHIQMPQMSYSLLCYLLLYSPTVIIHNCQKCQSVMDASVLYTKTGDVLFHFAFLKSFYSIHFLGICSLGPFSKRGMLSADTGANRIQSFAIQGEHL